MQVLEYKNGPKIYIGMTRDEMQVMGPGQWLTDKASRLWLGPGLQLGG